MGTIRTTVLLEAELRSLHEASLGILRDTGVVVRHPEILDLTHR